MAMRWALRHQGKTEKGAASRRDAAFPGLHTVLNQSPQVPGPSTVEAVGARCRLCQPRIWAEAR